MTTIPADFVAIFLVGIVVVVSFAQMYIWFYFRVAASHKAFPRCYTRFIIQSSPSETVTPKNTHSFGVPMDSQQAKDFPHFHPFLQPSLPFSLMALQRWFFTFQQQNNGNSARFKTKLFLQLYNLLDYWLLQMKRKKLKIMNWTKWFICWLSSHRNEGFGWLRLFSPGSSEWALPLSLAPQRHA